MKTILLSTITYPCLALLCAAQQVGVTPLYQPRPGPPLTNTSPSWIASSPAITNAGTVIQRRAWFGAASLNSRAAASAPLDQAAGTNSAALARVLDGADTAPGPALAEAPQAAPERIEIDASGAAVAGFGTHKLRFAPNPNTLGAVELTLPLMPGDSQPAVIRSHVLGLYYVLASGETVALAELQDTTGEVGGTRVMYAGALGGLADLVYECQRSSAEQDVIIRKRLPQPEAVFGPGASIDGLNIAVISEIVAGPEPRRVAGKVDLRGKNAELGIRGVESLPTETLWFGSTRFSAGKAFLLGQSGIEVPSSVNYTTVEGRRFLVELTPYSLLAAQIQTLPAGDLQGRVGPRGNLKSLLARSKMPKPANRPAENTKLAALDNLAPSNALVLQAVIPSFHRSLVQQSGRSEEPGVLLDYIITTGPLINVNCGSGAKTGFAALGQSGSDYWNSCPQASLRSIPNLHWSDGSTSPVGLVLSNAPGCWGNGINDAMYSSYVYPFNGGHVTVTITNLPPDQYSFYIYGHGPDPSPSTLEDPSSIEGYGLFQLLRAGVSLGQKSTAMWGYGWSSTNWEGGQQYIEFRSVAITNQSVSIDVSPAYGYATIAGLQIVPSAAVPPPSTIVSNLINVNLGDYSSAKVGFAATGLTTMTSGTGSGFLRNLPPPSPISKTPAARTPRPPLPSSTLPVAGATA